MAEYKIIEQADTSVFKVKGSLSIENICQIKDIFIDFLNNKTNVVIDISEIESLDLASLQLILSIFITMNQNKIRFSLLSKDNSAWKDIISSAGITKITLDKFLDSKGG